MSTRADVGRTAVYEAERAAFEGTSYESLVPFEALLALERAVTGQPWWPHGPVDVRPARAGAASSSTVWRGSPRPVVRLAAAQLTPATLIHELAHVLAGSDAGHGGRFRRAHVDLTAAAFGPDEAAWLADAYVAMSLTVPTARTWPRPPRPP